ncbi:hypothetical protein [Zooshikella harenae]|uniref:Nuclear transport factor 2 family protein n=1 Tax=Zooshikella harenae TaxID=2827238 RepID=A0ABS5Z6C1_9GAMM|nr:hypothetical protein [Zooshikella harenae]MBU2709601.1 hypothetical protein [Zooshikella harenae]
MNRKSTLFSQLIKALLALSISILLSACSSSPDEELIADAISDIQEGLETKNSKIVLNTLSDDFITNKNQDKTWVKRIMALYFLRHKSITILITQSDTQINKQHPNEANTEATVVLTGQAGWIPESGKIYHVIGRWKKNDDQWLLTYLDIKD